MLRRKIGSAVNKVNKGKKHEETNEMFDYTCFQRLAK